jgi:hypothetical protein
MDGPHAFELACARNDIDHRLTKPKHPWTNGQVERMNRTIKDATVKRYFYETHGELRAHLADFVTAYNFARRLKKRAGSRFRAPLRAPLAAICKSGSCKHPIAFQLRRQRRPARSPPPISARARPHSIGDDVPHP